MTRIGFIGLGAMGAPMAANLVVAGFAVRGFDVDAGAVDALTEHGGERAGSPADAAREAELLLVIVFDHAQAEQVLFGDDGAVATLPAGATVIMATTMAPGSARAMAERLAELDIDFVEAPCTGGVSGALAATLTFICAGAPRAVDAARPALEAMGSTVAICGERIGAGATVKMVNQLMCGLMVAATAEGIALAARAGADLEVTRDVIGSGAARSAVWDSHTRSILDGDYSPKGVVDIFVKDLDIVLRAGKELGFPLPLTAAALQQFMAAAAMGHGREDDAAVVKVYERLAGIDVSACTTSD